MRRVHVVVHGEVQGVFFRDSCRHEAQARGVTGWVRNTASGTVEAELEGEAGAVEAMIDWCGQGPRHARVERVDVRETDPTGGNGFEIR